MASSEKDTELIAIARTLKNVPWCEDYEKMISGMLYSCMAPPLLQGRHRARYLATKYNTHFPAIATIASLEADRNAMLTEMLGSIGKDACIEPPFFVDYGCNIIIGDRFYSNFNLTILDCSLVHIGDRVMLGPNVSIYAATHETSVQSRRDNIEYARVVRIGDDCWIGGGSTILPGVTIGEGCTVGAGSVVTRNVEPWCVVMGAPARVVRRVEPVGRIKGDEAVVENGGARIEGL